MDDDSFVSFLLSSKSVYQTLTQRYLKRVTHIQQNRRSYPVPDGSFARVGFTVDNASSLIDISKNDDGLTEMELSPNQPPIPETESVTEHYFYAGKVLLIAFHYLDVFSVLLEHTKKTSMEIGI